MRWSIFILFTYITLVMQDGLRVLFELDGITPSLVLVLAVYIGLRAPMVSLAWAWILLGVLVDLTYKSWTGGDADTTFALIGPMALGYLFGGFGVVQIRGMVFKDSPLALGVLVFILGIVVHLVAVLLLSIRNLSDPMLQWSASHELVARFFELLYSAVIAVPFGYLLFRSTPIWGFEKNQGSRH